jgi:hypothetical protein
VQTAVWDARAEPAGVYIVRATSSRGECLSRIVTVAR